MTFTDTSTSRMAESLLRTEKCFDWRVHQWGLVCLTFREAQAVVYEAQALYEGMEGRALTAWVASRMRTTRQHVIRLLETAALCLLYLQHRAFYKRVSDLAATIGFVYNATRCEFSAPVEGKWQTLSFPVRRVYEGALKVIGKRQRHWKNLLREPEPPFRGIKQPPTVPILATVGV